jgi:hypothetical protein
MVLRSAAAIRRNCSFSIAIGFDARVQRGTLRGNWRFKSGLPVV